jgi:hypothetical protein
MSRIPYPEFIGQTYQAQSVFVGVEQLINMYPEKAPVQGTTKSAIYYYHTPGTSIYCTMPAGLTTFYGMLACINFYPSTVSAGPITPWTRGKPGLFVLAGTADGDYPHLVQINGQEFPGTQVFDWGQLPALATGALAKGLPPSTYQMVWNGQQILIIGYDGPGIPAVPNAGVSPNPAGYWVADFTIALGGTAPFLISQSFGTIQPTSITVMDGYPVVTNGLYSQKAGHPTPFGPFGLGDTVSSGDFGTYTFSNALAFGTVVDEPELLVGIRQHLQQLFIFGYNATRCWQDVGNFPFPFAPIEGATFEIGCASNLSIAELASSLFWIGRDARGSAVCYKTQGYNGVRVSTPAVEAVWQSYATVSDSVAYSIQVNGHWWYVVSFLDANATWVYDVTAEMWFEWQGPTGGLALPVYHVFDEFSQVHIGCGGDATGNVYTLSTNVYTDNSLPITRSRTAPHLSQEMLDVFYQQFQMDVQVGDASPRTYMVSWSNDGGNTYSPPVAITTQAGNFLSRVRLLGTGYSRNRVFRVTTTDALPQAWIAAWLELEAGTT